MIPELLPATGPRPCDCVSRAARAAARAPAGVAEAVAPRPRPAAGSRLPGGVLVYVGALSWPSRRRRRRPLPPRGSASARRARAAGRSAPPGPARSGRHAALEARGPSRVRPQAPPQP